LRRVIKQAMIDLDNYKQGSYVVDILDVYFTEHVKKVLKNEAVDDFFVELCHFAIQNGDVRRCQKLFERIIAHTNNKRPQIASYLAETQKI